MSDLAIQPAQTVDTASFIDEWERQPGESSKAFSTFVIFRDMGDERGVTKLRDEAGVKQSLKTLMQWATTHRWIERANAWDRYLDRRRQKAAIEEIEAMARRQVQTGQVLQGVGLEYVQENLDTPEKRAKNLNANGALRYIDRGVDLEREGLGLNDKESAGDTNIQINVLDAGTKSDVFDKIDQMAANFEAMKDIASRNGAPEPMDILDADIVSDDGELAL